MSASLAEPVIAAPTPAGRAKRGGVPVIHAEPPALDPALGGDAALRRIGLAGLDHLSRNEAAALAGMPGGIHQMRVAARRLRAMLSGFAQRLPEHQRHWAFEELCWLADGLATARATWMCSRRSCCGTRSEPPMTRSPSSPCDRPRSGSAALLT